MRIRMNEQRERRYDRLKEASSANDKSNAIDEAANFYLRMKGSNIEVGTLQELIETAEQEGSLTAAEIAQIVDTPHVPVGYSTQLDIGDMDD